MAQTAPDHLLTGEDLLELGDLGPCELVDGKIEKKGSEPFRFSQSSP
jgi:hypothetical protein